MEILRRKLSLKWTSSLDYENQQINQDKILGDHYSKRLFIQKNDNFTEDKLNTFAKILDFKDWQDFKSEYPIPKGFEFKHLEYFKYLDSEKQAKVIRKVKETLAKENSPFSLLTFEKTSYIPDSVSILKMRRDLIGRDKKLEEVFRKLTQKQKSFFPMIQVYGYGGMGKTSFAKGLVKKYKPYFRQVIWVKYTSDFPRSFLYFTALQDELDFEPKDTKDINQEIINGKYNQDKSKAYFEENFTLLVRLMNKQDPHGLIIVDIDYAESEDEIQRIHPTFEALREKYSILILQRTSIKFSGLETIRLEGLARQDSRQLFTDLWDETNYPLPKNTAQILEKLHDTPKLIELFAGLSKQKMTTPFDEEEALKKIDIIGGEELDFEKVLEKTIQEIYKMCHFSDIEKFCLKMLALLPKATVTDFKKLTNHIYHPELPKIPVPKWWQFWKETPKIEIPELPDYPPVSEVVENLAKRLWIDKPQQKSADDIFYTLHQSIREMLKTNEKYQITDFEIVFPHYDELFAPIWNGEASEGMQEIAQYAQDLMEFFERKEDNKNSFGFWSTLMMINERLNQKRQNVLLLERIIGYKELTESKTSKEMQDYYFQAFNLCYEYEPHKAKYYADILKNHLDNYKTNAKFIYSLSRVYQLSGEYELALHYVRQAKRLNKNEKSAHNYSANLNLEALILKDLNRNEDDLKNALKSIREAIVITEGLDNEKDLAISYDTQAQILKNLNRNEDDLINALESVQKSIEIKEKLNDKRGLGISYDTQAQILNHLNRNEDDLINALKSIQESIKIDKELDNQRGLGIAWCHKGEILLFMNKTSEALTYAEKGFEQIQRYHSENHAIYQGAQKLLTKIKERIAQEEK